MRSGRGGVNPDREPDRPLPRDRWPGSGRADPRAGRGSAARLEDALGDRSEDEATELGEARRHFRSSLKVRWPAEFALIAAPYQSRATAQALGVSLGGTFVVCDTPPPLETDLHLWLYPPRRSLRTPRSLRLLAQVRWVNASADRLPRGFGVEFRAITAADEIALHRCFSWSAKVI